MNERRPCSDGRACHYTVQGMDLGGGIRVVEHEEGPNLVPNGRTRCDECLLAEVGLLHRETYASDDRLGMSPLYREDEVAEALVARGLPDETWRLTGRYDPTDRLSMTCLIDEAALVGLLVAELDPPVA